MIEKILEKTKDADEDVRKEAVASLGKLKEISTSELGKVVIALLDLFEDKTLRNDGEEGYYTMRNDPGDSLYELSTRWDLGKSIPKELRKQVIEQIINLDAKSWFFHVVRKVYGHTAYDAYDYQKDVPLLPKFRGLFSSYLEVEYLLEITQSPIKEVCISTIRELGAVKKKVRKDTRRKVVARLLELTLDELFSQEAAKSLNLLGEVIPEDQREEVVEQFLFLLKIENIVTREKALNLGSLGSIVPLSQRKVAIERLLEIYRETCYTFKGGRHPEPGDTRRYISCLSYMTDIIPEELQNLVVQTLLEFTKDENNDIKCAAILNLDALVVNNMVPNEHLKTIKTRFNYLQNLPREYDNFNMRYFAEDAFRSMEHLESSKKS